MTLGDVLVTMWVYIRTMGTMLVLSVLTLLGFLIVAFVAFVTMSWVLLGLIWVLTTVTGML